MMRNLDTDRVMFLSGILFSHDCVMRSVLGSAPMLIALAYDLIQIQLIPRTVEDGNGPRQRVSGGEERYLILDRQSVGTNLIEREERREDCGRKRRRRLGNGAQGRDSGVVEIFAHREGMNFGSGTQIYALYHSLDCAMGLDANVAGLAQCRRGCCWPTNWQPKHSLE